MHHGFFYGGYESAVARDASSQANAAAADARRARSESEGLTQDLWGTNGGYGLSETFTVATDLRADSSAALRADTAGAPLPGMEIRIVDPDSGEVLPPRSAGEIIVRGMTLMRRYHRVPLAECFDTDGR